MSDLGERPLDLIAVFLAIVFVGLVFGGAFFLLLVLAHWGVQQA